MIADAMNQLIAGISANAYLIAFGSGVFGLVLIAGVFHRAVVDLAVRAERDACAETAEALSIEERGQWSAGARAMRDRIAAAIRSRGGRCPPRAAGLGDPLARVSFLEMRAKRRAELIGRT